MNKDQNKNVAVIGAGAAGLITVKALLEEGLCPVVFEADAEPLGIWNYKKEEDEQAAYQSLHTNVTKDIMALSDFPFDPKLPHYPSWQEVKHYLDNYGRKFKLYQYIKYESKITKIIYSGHEYILTIDHKGEIREERYKKLVICTGMFNTKYIPEMPELKDYTGKIIHAVNYKDSTPYKKRKVLVVGIGSSAVDIASDLSETGADISVSARKSSIVIPQFFNFKPFDHHNGKINKFYSNKKLAKKFKKMHQEECKRRNIPSDLKEFNLPSFDYDISLNKVVATERFVNGLSYGKIKGFPGIQSSSDKQITFTNGSKGEFDTIILATGYDPVLPEMENINLEIIDKIPVSYLHIFPIDYPNLSFTGRIWVKGGAFPPMEMQARLISAVYSGRVKLPSYLNMKASIEKEISRKEKMKMDYSWVIPVPYMDKIAKMIGAYPGYLYGFSVLKAILKGPFRSYQYRLKGEGKDPRAKQHLKQKFRYQ
ncbi:MAG: flavin-containing monooxygenase [Hyphomicrobiales bacterium]